MLFAPVIGGSARDRVARLRASAAFYNARTTVPAYREFLREHNAENPSEWEHVPLMDKASYIKRWPIEQLCQGGTLPLRGAVIDESSGSSGTASNWIRGSDERAATRRLIQYSARSVFGDQSFILLNAFALGPWATGMNVSMSLVDRCVLKSIGPDVSKVVATLKLLGPKYRYVITGYPPFLKVLVDTADIDWNEFDVCAVVGGEGMSEPLRASLNKCFRKTISSYGASDLEINLGVETEFTIALRQAIASDSSIGESLYGHEALPMIFQYDPLNVFIESDAERSLLFTINRLENVSPRIRYNLHDRGVVRTMDAVQRILKERGVRVRHDGPSIGLPLLFHWGRQDNSVGFYGCKITPEDIQHVILRLAALGSNVANFALRPYEDDNANKRLELLLEMADGVALPDAAPLGDDIWRELAAVNQDFRESIKMIPAERRPTIKLYSFGQSPISAQDIRIKKRYIV
jgi:phenylacetate-CoA ligase